MKIKKKPNGGKAPVKGTKEQYDNYRDSLELYGRYSELGLPGLKEPPVQPIIYEPEVNYQRPPATHSSPPQGAVLRNTLPDGTRYYAANDTSQYADIIIYPQVKQRSKEQAIKMSKYEPIPGKSITEEMEFNPIPYKKGSYFTREQQGQEVGGKEYFDKTTGKKLENGGFVERKSKTGRIFRYKSYKQ